MHKNPLWCPPVFNVLALIVALYFVASPATSIGAESANPYKNIRPADIPPYLDINHLTPAQWAGAVSAAMEGMRLVYGPMIPERERAFEAEWQPAFEFPNQDVIVYFNKLNPLLIQFLGTRNALAEAITTFDAAQLDAIVAAGEGDAESVETAMASATLESGLIKSLQLRLEKVTAAILALGPLPDAKALRLKARKAHEDAFREFEKPAGKLAIVPSKLAATPGVTYEFAVRVKDLPENGKYELGWSFSDLTSKRTALSGTVKHAFYGDPKKPEQFLRVQLIDVVSGLVLAAAESKITLAFPRGYWVLVDRQVTESEQGDKGPRFKGGGIDAKTGKPVSFAEEPGNIFDNGMELKELSARLFNFNLTKTKTLEMHEEWSQPPLKLAPEEKLDMTLTAKFVNGTHKPVTCYAQLFGGCEFYPWGPKLQRKEMSLGGVMAQASGPTERPSYLVEDKGPKLALDQTQHLVCTMPRPYVVDSKGMPIKLDGQFLILKVSGQASMIGRGPRFTVLYRYQWDPTGNSLKQYGSNDEPIASDATGNSDNESPDQRELRLKRERLEFHKANIDYFQKNIQDIEARLYGTADPQAQDALRRDLLYNKDALQREQDQIATIQTGGYVHTRTELDALNFDMMAREGRETAQKWDAINRIVERMPRLIGSAPPEDRDRLRAFYFRQIDSTTIADGDLGKMRRVAATIGDQVIGRYEHDAAVAEAGVIDASQKVAFLENVKGVCDNSLMALSFVGGQPVYMTYQGITGYQEGGWEQAFKQTAGAYNMATIFANEAIDGYQRGVLEHLEEYARDPEKVKLDESAAGLSGAGWSVGKAAAMAAVMHLGMNALSPGLHEPSSSGNKKWPTVEQQLAEAKFRSEQANGRSLVKLYERRCAKLAEAGKAGASNAEILQLRQSAEAAYKAIKVDYHAKAHIKSLGQAGDLKTVHYYNSMDRKFSNQLQAQLEKNMADAGWSPQKYKLYGNSASKGKAGMDVDLGVVEPPRYITPSEGPPVPNPDYSAWRRALTQNGTRKSTREFQQEGQKALEKAFEDVYGRKPGEAFANFTTSGHSESYKDMAWLGRKGMKTADFDHVDPKWAGQAGDVTNFKINSLPRDHPSLGRYKTLQEQCRGACKDFQTKLEPNLKNSPNPKAAEHMRDLHCVMDDFVNNRIGPIEAERRLQILTGGEGISGVSDRMRIMIGHLPTK